MWIIKFCRWLCLFLLIPICPLQSNPLVLVVGGAGYIGSHMVKLLNQEGYSTIVLDNLSTGNRKAVTTGIFIEGSLEDGPLLNELFDTYPINAVMHFAGSISVNESMGDPGLYYRNNVVNTLNLLDSMKRHAVNKIIFSSTASIFGNPLEVPIKETQPCAPLNPYGASKWMVERILQDFDQAHGIRYCCLRYFNVSGGDPSGELKNYKSNETHLIPLALQSLKDPQAVVKVFGTDYPTPDGTCIRDYIHVMDVCAAHLLALKKLQTGTGSSCYNLGNGRGFSVLEVLTAIEKVTGQKLNILKGPRREGDPPCSIADSCKAKNELGWTPQYSSLETIIEHAWKALN
jgi:UDP-glucose 4-epimerase